MPERVKLGVKLILFKCSFTQTGEKGFARQADGMLERTAWLKSEMDKLNWPVWQEPMSNIVYFKCPPKSIVDKYALATEQDDRLGGKLSHIVIMQHVTKKHLQEFLNDLASSAKEN